MSISSNQLNSNTLSLLIVSGEKYKKFSQLMEEAKQSYEFTSENINNKPRFLALFRDIWFILNNDVIFETTQQLIDKNKARYVIASNIMNHQSFAKMKALSSQSDAFSYTLAMYLGEAILHWYESKLQYNYELRYSYELLYGPIYKEKQDTSLLNYIDEPYVKSKLASQLEKEIEEDYNGYTLMLERVVGSFGDMMEATVTYFGMEKWEKLSFKEQVSTVYKLLNSGHLIDIAKQAEACKNSFIYSKQCIFLQRIRNISQEPLKLGQGHSKSPFVICLAQTNSMYRHHIKSLGTMLALVKIAYEYGRDVCVIPSAEHVEQYFYYANNEMTLDNILELSQIYLGGHLNFVESLNFAMIMLKLEYDFENGEIAIIANNDAIIKTECEQSWRKALLRFKQENNISISMITFDEEQVDNERFWFADCVFKNNTNV